MARRKAVKHADTEPVDRAAEAGDASPPKRKKAVAKTTAKSEEDKPARPARAAKAVRTEQPDPEIGSAPAATNARAKAKASAAKTAVAPVKPSARAKTSSKKAKEALEKSNNGPIEPETTKNGGEIQPKKARAKPAPKKAGTADGDELKAKPKGRGKKVIAVEEAEEAEDSELLPAKKKRTANTTKVVAKEVKPKGRATKKKTDEPTDAKTKVAATKGPVKGTNNNVVNDKEIDNEITEIEKIGPVQKRGKAVEDKVTKPAARGTRTRQNKAVTETTSEEGDEAKNEAETASESSQSTENEVEEGQSQESDTTVPVQPPKRGRNMKKKDDSVVPKKTAKTRGKVAEAAIEEDGIDTAKNTKETQKKTGKENAPSAAASKRGTRKKGVPTSVTVNEESSDKKTDTEDTSIEEKEELNTTQTLHVNNNIDKSEVEPENEEVGVTILKKEYIVDEKTEPLAVEGAEN